MKQEDFIYSVETAKEFDDAVVSVIKEVEKKGWALFNVYDVKERLAVKGFEQKPLKIIEICSGRNANKMLNKNRLISLCMPCKINVFEDKGKIKIAGMNPRMISMLFPEISKEETAEIEKDIREIVDNAK